MSETTYDGLAGIVDLFGALACEELETALDELAFKRGCETDDDTLLGTISDAVNAYYPVPYEDDKMDAELLTVGLMAFPILPNRAEDLPHIFDYPTREMPQDELTTQVESRLRVAATSAVQTGDADEIERLLDVMYDLEAWVDIGVGPIRERLDAALDTEGQA